MLLAAALLFASPVAQAQFVYSGSFGSNTNGSLITGSVWVHRIVVFDTSGASPNTTHFFSAPSTNSEYTQPEWIEITEATASTSVTWVDALGNTNTNTYTQLSRTFVTNAEASVQYPVIARLETAANDKTEVIFIEPYAAVNGVMVTNLTNTGTILIEYTPM